MTKQATRFDFTNRAIKALPAAAPDTKGDEYTDKCCAGLKISVGLTGRKVFWYRYTTLAGKKRAIRIGDFGGIDVAEARQTVAKYRAIVDRGGDPQDARDRVKAMPTFGEFVEGPYFDYAKVVKRSFKDDYGRYHNHLKAKFSKSRLVAITKRDIEQHHADIANKQSPATANRHLALLSAIMRKALEWNVIDVNPCQGVKQFKENNSRQAFLNMEQIGRYVLALEADENKVAAGALKLALLTGARRGEVLSAKHADVHLDQGVWLLPMTKNGRSRNVSLSVEARNLISSLPRHPDSPWLFPGYLDPMKPAHNITKTHKRALFVAKLPPSTRIHDLRHTNASVMASSGAINLMTIQKNLGHSTPEMSLRYAHLADKTALEAASYVGNAVSNAVSSAKERLRKLEEVDAEFEAVA